MAALSDTVRGAVLGLTAFGLYALYDITIKFLGGSYSPLQVLFVAGSFAMPLVLAQALWRGGTLRPALPGLMALRAGVALANGVIGAYAFVALPLAEAYAVFFTMPLLIAALGALFLGEPMDARRVLAILAGLGGVMVALQPGEAELSLGHAAALAAAMLGAANYVLVRRTGGVERPALMLLWPLAVQWAATGLAMPFLWQPMPPAHLGLAALMAVQLVAGGLFIVAAYRASPVIVVAPMQYSQIAWGLILGAVLFGETIDAPKAIGIAIIIAAGLATLTYRVPAESRV
jgi:S-adenosylmethionine uptake transporter